MSFQLVCCKRVVLLNAGGVNGCVVFARGCRVPVRYGRGVELFAKNKSFSEVFIFIVLLLSCSDDRRCRGL